MTSSIMNDKIDEGQDGQSSFSGIALYNGNTTSCQLGWRNERHYLEATRLLDAM